MAISQESLTTIKTMQVNEATEALIYRAIAARVKDAANRQVLERIAAEEEAHAKIWQQYTGEAARPKKGKVLLYSLLARVLGFTFAVKHMENGEEKAQDKYAALTREVPEADKIRTDEAEHEVQLLGLLDEERLRYVGSMVLGLNDALVELTGTLAGLTFALQDNKLVALSGLITGISATFSMASSEFLSARSAGKSDALKSCIYTGIAYLLTVTLLVLPYLLIPNPLISLVVMLVIVVGIIALFNYYIAVAQGVSFRSRFTEMAVISLGVAALSFGVGLLVKLFLGVDV